MSLEPGAKLGPYQVVSSPSFTRTTDVAAIPGGILFLSESSSGHELWRTDGTAAGTSLLANVCSVCSGAVPPQLETAGGLAYLSAGPSGERSLWVSDATVAGTAPVAAFPAGSDVWTPTPLGGGVLVHADVDPDGREPWFSDGTVAGTFLLADIWPGPDASQVQPFEVFGAAALFAATSGTSAGLWLSPRGEPSSAAVRRPPVPVNGPVGR